MVLTNRLIKERQQFQYARRHHLLNHKPDDQHCHHSAEPVLIRSTKDRPIRFWETRK